MFDSDRLKLAVALLWEVEQDDKIRPKEEHAKRITEFLREYRESRPAYVDPALVDGAKR